MKNKDSVELIEYTKAQDALNCVTHALGAVLGAAVLILLIKKAVPFNSARYMASAIVYGLSLILLYSASAVYHGLPQGEAKRTARLVDHSVIPILLAGTATPCALITLYNHNKICCAAVLLLGWGSMIFGLVAKLFFFQKTKAACVAVYIIAGAVMLSCSLARGYRRDKCTCAVASRAWVRGLSLRLDILRRRQKAPVVPCAVSYVHGRGQHDTRLCDIRICFHSRVII